MEARNNTPAKNIGLKKGDEIIQINDKKTPSKKDMDVALKECEGREINLHIKNESGTVTKKIKPYKRSKGKKIKKWYDIGAIFFERESDPFIDKLLIEYSLKCKKVAILPDKVKSTKDYHERLSEIKLKHPKAYEKWTDEEDKKLRNLMKAKKSVRDISVILERQPSAIRSRIIKFKENDRK